MAYPILTTPYASGHDGTKAGRRLPSYSAEAHRLANLVIHPPLWINHAGEWQWQA